MIRRLLPLTLSEYGHKIRRPCDSGEMTYLRDTTFDAAIAVIFPKLKESLADGFATRHFPARGTGGTTAIYRGLAFKTRLKAQWAAFFDLLDWTWQGDPQAVRDWQLDFPCGHSECGGYHRLLVSVVLAKSIDEHRAHPALGFLYGYGTDEERIPADSGALFGLDPPISSFDISHSAGGGRYTVAEFSRLSSWPQTWAQAGQRVA